MFKSHVVRIIHTHTNTYINDIWTLFLLIFRPYDRITRRSTSLLTLIRERFPEEVGVHNGGTIQRGSCVCVWVEVLWKYCEAIILTHKAYYLNLLPPLPLCYLLLHHQWLSGPGVIHNKCYHNNTNTPTERVV